MVSLLRISISLLLLTYATIFAFVEESHAETTVNQHGLDLAKWLHDKGGFMSDKLEIRRRIPDDPKSPSGVFAVKDISPSEKIFHFPRQSYLRVPETQVLKFNAEEYMDKIKDLEDDDQVYEVYIEEMDQADMDVYYDNCCLLVKRLMEEIQLYRTSPSSSEFAPYIRYLEETQKKGQLPATYSQAGKALLRKIQGISESSDDFGGHKAISPNFRMAPLPPVDLVDWIDQRFVNKGCINANDTYAYHAAELTIQRGFDLELIPIWDMVNHDIGERINVETNSLRSEEGLIVWAKQHITAGDEILYTYNHCTDCSEIGLEWGTPGIYRDFGFIEDYPQEWPFLDQDVYSTIVRNQENQDRFSAVFYSEIDGDEVHLYGPNASGLLFFEEQLSRLQCLEIDTEINRIASPIEQVMIRKFYSSLKTAIATVIHDGKQNLEEQRMNNSEVASPSLGDDEL